MSDHQAPIIRKDFFVQVRENWFIIVFIGSMVLGYGKIQSDIQQSRIETARNATDIAKIWVQINDNQNQVSEVKGDIKAIKESVDYIKKALQ